MFFIASEIVVRIGDSWREGGGDCLGGGCGGGEYQVEKAQRVFGEERWVLGSLKVAISFVSGFVAAFI